MLRLALSAINPQKLQKFCYLSISAPFSLLIVAIIVIFRSSLHINPMVGEKTLTSPHLIPTPTDPLPLSEGSKLYGDVGRGIFAAGAVAVPLSLGVTVIDRSVTLFSNGKCPSLGKVSDF